MLPLSAIQPAGETIFARTMAMMMTITTDLTILFVRLVSLATSPMTHTHTASQTHAIPITEAALKFAHQSAGLRRAPVIPDTPHPVPHARPSTTVTRATAGAPRRAHTQDLVPAHARVGVGIQLRGHHAP